MNGPIILIYAVFDICMCNASLISVLAYAECFIQFSISIYLPFLSIQNLFRVVEP